MEDNSMRAIYAALFLILPLSSLLARRLPIGQTLKMVAGWIGIFGVLFIVGLYRDEFRGLWDRARADLTGDGITASGGELRVRKREDGHFWVHGTINDRPISYMVDSGATMTTVSKREAIAAGIVLPDESMTIEVETANGLTRAWPVRVERFAVGEIARSDFPIDVATSDDDVNLLGMNFLSSLKSWRVEGDQMILAP